MHVITLERQPSAAHGGQQLSLLDVCRGLHRRGHRVSVMYNAPGNLMEHYRAFCHDMVRANQFYIDKHQFVLTALRFLADVGKVRRPSESGIVYGNQYQDSVFAAAVARAKRLPVVCHLRQPPPATGRIPKRFVLGMKNIHRFIAVSHGTKADWVRAGIPAESIDVVHNGINPSEFPLPVDRPALRRRWNLEPTDDVIAYAGRLDRQKGVETVILAVARLRRAGMAARLLIAGKPLNHPTPAMAQEYLESLHELSRQQGIEQYVRFVGHLPQMAELYQVSDVTVLPALWPEPFGRTLIESMACGTPAVGSRAGGIPEILGGAMADRLFEPGNDRALAEVLDRTLRGKADAHRARDCRDHVIDNFTIARTVERVERILLRAVAEFRPREQAA